MLSIPRSAAALAVTTCLLVSVETSAQDKEAGLHFKPVPAEKSGLSHVLNSDPKLGMIKYPWLSPPVDIDGDGHLDAILYGHHGGGAMIFLGKGDGTFTFDDQGYAKRWAFGGRDPVWIQLQGKRAVDAIGAEGTGVSGRVFLNEGKGTWRKTELSLPRAGIGDYQLIDADGDGLHREIFVSTAGIANRVKPLPGDWARAGDKDSLQAEELWSAEKIVGWPEGLEKGQGAARAGYRDAYSVDLDGDHKNELIVHIKAPGFTPTQLLTWVLGRDGAAWKDSTAERGLPTGTGHWLYPEDIDVDGHLDLVDLHTGLWYRNDGKGRFAVSPQRVFDPENRIGRLKKALPWTTDNELQWLDLDNNGYRDLVTATDHGIANGVFLNLGKGRFVEVEGIPGSRRNRKFGDVDGDHRLDMISFDKDRLTLHRNETPGKGIHVLLQPAVSSDAHLGAKLWVYEAGQLGDPAALIHYQQGFMTRDAGRSQVLVPDLHVGIGSRDAVDVRVRYPGGAVRAAKSVKAGSRVTLPEQER